MDFSMLWETQTGTGDGQFTYTQGQSNEFFRNPSQSNVAAQGPLYSGNGLEVTGATSPLQMDTGDAIVYGFRGWNRASKNLTVAAVAADTGGRVVLRADWTASTLRQFVIQSASGVTAFPALTQTAGTTWEVPLANFVSDNAGNIWTDASKTIAGVADARQFSGTPLAGSELIAIVNGDGTQNIVTFDSIPQHCNGLKLVIVGKTSSGLSNSVITFNSDTGANYTLSTITGQSAAVAHTSGTANGITVSAPASGTFVSQDQAELNMPNYSQATHEKSLRYNSGSIGNGTAPITSWGHGWWLNTAAITRIDVTLGALNNLTADSYVALYGMR